MIAEKIKTLRTERKESQQVVADYLGITRQAYSLYELGKREPDYETLLKLAKYFDVSVALILGEQRQKSEVADEDIRFALFHGEDGISDEAYEEVKAFARFVKEKYEKKK